eukprot:2740725-Prymnesium_polylepis.1
MPCAPSARGARCTWGQRVPERRSVGVVRFTCLRVFARCAFCARLAISAGVRQDGAAESGVRVRGARDTRARGGAPPQDC